MSHPHRFRRIGLLATAAALALATGCSASPVTEVDGREAVTMTTVGAFPVNDPQMDGYRVWLEEVEKHAPWVTVDFRGASEIMNSGQLGEAVSTGAIDMGVTAAAFHSHIVPINNALALSPFSPSEERANGTYEVLQEAHERAGMHYLGRWTPGLQYQLYLDQPIESPDLAGRSIRTSPVYIGLLQKLGAAPVAMPPGDVYTAMERGVIEGFGWPQISVTFNSWEEVTNYEIDAQFYQVDCIFVVNKSFWDSLDDETRTALDEATIAAEERLATYFQEKATEEREERLAAGMQLIELSDEAREDLLEAAEVGGWNHALRVAPETEELRDIFLGEEGNQ